MNKNEVFIIAEISANHGNDIEIVKQTMQKAKKIGANAVKFQTYQASSITLNSDRDEFIINDKNSLWNGSKLYDLYKEGLLPWEWHKELFEFAKELDIVCFSTPFDFKAVDLLEECNCPIYKVASFEINDIPLLEYIASKGKPIILSSGVGSFEEIKLAIETCRKYGIKDITLLKTTSQYPAKIEDANLNTMLDFAKTFNVKIGISDHTEGFLVPVVATALGAKVIEKHFILDRQIGGPDASFSMEPDEFKQMIDLVRDTEKSLGKVDYDVSDKTKQRLFMRSYYISKDVKKGEIISFENIQSVRPAKGLEPKLVKDVLGKKFKSDFAFASPLNLEMIE